MNPLVRSQIRRVTRVSGNAPGAFSGWPRHGWAVPCRGSRYNGSRHQRSPRADSPGLAVYRDAAIEADRVRRARGSLLNPVSRDPGDGRMVGRGCGMRALSFVVVSCDRPCDLWSTRPARALVTRAAADAVACLAPGRRSCAGTGAAVPNPTHARSSGGTPCCGGTPEAVPSRHGHDLLPAGRPAPRATPPGAVAGPGSRVKPSGLDPAVA
jgi:hypothetical protein